MGENQREIYFIVPRKKVPFLDDTRTMQAVAELHTQSPVDAVILHTQRNFPVLREYCGQNLIHRIDVRQHQESMGLTEEFFRGYKRTVYVADKRGNLSTQAKELSEKGFKTEIRELF